MNCSGIKEVKRMEDNIIKDVRNFFILKKEMDGLTVGNFWSKNYIEYESNSDRNKTLSTEEYLNIITILKRAS